jgi:hypothetical protein
MARLLDPTFFFFLVQNGVMTDLVEACRLLREKQDQQAKVSRRRFLGAGLASIFLGTAATLLGKKLLPESQNASRPKNAETLTPEQKELQELRQDYYQARDFWVSDSQNSELRMKALAASFKRYFKK